MRSQHLTLAVGRRSRRGGCSRLCWKGREHSGGRGSCAQLAAGPLTGTPELLPYPPGQSLKRRFLGAFSLPGGPAGRGAEMRTDRSCPEGLVAQ